MRTVSTESLSIRRCRRLVEALKDCNTLRRYLRDNARDETELLFMLQAERERWGRDGFPPRRSVLKRLHSAYCTVRARNEWAELERWLR